MSDAVCKAIELGVIGLACIICVCLLEGGRR